MRLLPNEVIYIAAMAECNTDVHVGLAITLMLSMH